MVYRLLLDRLERYERASSSDSCSDLSSSSDSDSDLSSTSSGINGSARGMHDSKRPKTAHQFNPHLAHLHDQRQSSSSRETTPNRGSKTKTGAKRLPVTTKLRKIQHVPRDENGKPILPLQLGIVTIYDLGTIVWDRKNFHSERYIYPVGYKMSRSYASIVDPESNTTYTCTISDGHDGPRFHVSPDDIPEKAVTAGTATGAWTSIIKAANALRKREHSNSASGPDYFGLSHPTVAALIQELPNAHRCENYVRHEYEESQGRGVKRAAVKPEKPPVPIPSASPMPATGNSSAQAYSNGLHAYPATSNFDARQHFQDIASSPKTAASDIPEWSETGSAMMDDDLGSREPSMVGEIQSGDEEDYPSDRVDSFDHSDGGEE
ncbi:F/Y-rich N-terminus-domain-containing protein [Powellomyces hirtus]|nr:F/Y-rich N-terminus-domain-containing protein [Powellomyces hirtus]